MSRLMLRACGINDSPPSRTATLKKLCVSLPLVTSHCWGPGPGLVCHEAISKMATNKSADQADTMFGGRISAFCIILDSLALHHVSSTTEPKGVALFTCPASYESTRSTECQHGATRHRQGAWAKGNAATEGPDSLGKVTPFVSMTYARGTICEWASGLFGSNKTDHGCRARPRASDHSAIPNPPPLLYTRRRWGTLLELAVQSTRQNSNKGLHRSGLIK